MKRPMCILAVSWLAGLLLAGHGAEIGTGVVLFVYFILIILGLLVIKKYSNVLTPQVQMEWYPQLTLLILMIPCLFLIGYWRMEQYSSVKETKELPWKLLSQEGENYVTIEGVVQEKRMQEQVVLELAECVIIGYYGQENQPAGDCRVRVEAEGKEWFPETFPGNKLRVFGTFSVFQPASNPGQFDAYDYYTGQGLFAEVSALRITVLEEELSVIQQFMLLTRQRLRESMTSLYPVEKAGVLLAMIAGDKELLSKEVETLYRQNGIAHIIAISGLHISALCLGLYGILRKLTIPVWVATVISGSFLVCYIIFTGASTSALRAGVMCLIMLGAKLLRRSYDLLSSLSLAAIVVTAFRPSEITSAGFLLSFGAVLGVALAKEVEYGLWQELQVQRPWWNIFLFSGMIQCITIPISLWFFYELSPYSIFLNLIVIPLVSLVLGGGIVSAVLGIAWPVAAKFPAGGTYLILEFYEWLCEKGQKLPFSFVLLGRPAVWQMMVYYGLVVFALWLFFKKAAKQKEKQEQSLAERKKNASALAGILATGMLWALTILFFSGKRNTELMFLDVSQGDGALITTAEGTVILSDCGSSDLSRVGEYRLFPVLKQNGMLLVDLAVVSHLDSDHISGIKELLEAMPVYEDELSFSAGYKGVIGIKELVLPKVLEKSEAYAELEKLALSKQVQVHYMQAGEVLYQEEDLLIECIYPREAKNSENDTSLVLLLQTPKLLAWFMGDAGTSPEKEMLSGLAAVNMEALRNGKTVLLKVGHHGSKTSSGETFVEFVKPDIAVISCGYRNSYGHPHAAVVERLLACGAEVFRTDRKGAIVVELGRLAEPKVYGWRKKVRE